MFDAALANKAAAQALNTSVRQAQVAQSRAVAQVYNVRRAEFKRTLILRRAKPNNLEAISISVSRPAPITIHRPKQNDVGIVVSVKKGQPKVIPGAFLAEFGSGRHLGGARRVPGSSVHESMRKRSKHHGRTNRRGKRKGQLIKREALKQIYGATLAHLADNPEIVQAARDKVAEVFPGEFEERLQKLLLRKLR